MEVIRQFCVSYDLPPDKETHVVVWKLEAFWMNTSDEIKVPGPCRESKQGLSVFPACRQVETLLLVT